MVKGPYTLSARGDLGAYGGRKTIRTGWVLSWCGDPTIRWGLLDMILVRFSRSKFRNLLIFELKDDEYIFRMRGNAPLMTWCRYCDSIKRVWVMICLVSPPHIHLVSPPHIHIYACITYRYLHEACSHPQVCISQRPDKGPTFSSELKTTCQSREKRGSIEGFTLLQEPSMSKIQAQGLWFLKMQNTRLWVNDSILS